MKSLLKLYVIAGVLILFTSCQRAAQDNSKVFIQLPSAANTPTNISKIVSFSTMVLNSDNNANGVDEFLSIVPTGYSGDHPINCYLVAVTGSGDLFKKNYCGKLDATTGEPQRDFEFGNYLGLSPAGSQLELTLESSGTRKFHILGLYAESPLNCIALAQHPSKTGLTKPYYLGSSGDVELTGGDMSVAINMTSVATAQAFDDCNIEELDGNRNDPILKPLANVAVVDSLQFPYKNLRVPVAGYTCEPLDVFLKSTSAGIQIPATVESTLPMTIQRSYTFGGTGFADIETYATNLACTSNVVGEAQFYFFRNESVKRRWIRVDSATASDIFFRTSSSLGTSDYTSYLSMSPSLQVYDHFFPKKVMPDTCYETTLFLRSSAGSLLTSGSTVGVSTNNGGVTFYGSQSNCLNKTTAQTAFTLSTGGVTIYMNTGTVTSAATLNFSGSARNTPTTVSFSSTPSAGESVLVSHLNFTGKNYLNGGICSPLYVHLNNNEGTDIFPTNSGSLEIVAAQSSIADVNLYDSSAACATNVLNINAPITASANKSFIKLYIKPVTGLVSYGPRRISFIYRDATGAIKAQNKFEFSVTNSDY